MSDRRERVAAAIEGVPNFSTIQDVAQAAIAAMGLPTREAVEKAIDVHFLARLEWLGARLEHGDSGPNTDPLFEKYIAARQRLLDLIVMTEATDER